MLIVKPLTSTKDKKKLAAVKEEVVVQPAEKDIQHVKKLQKFLHEYMHMPVIITIIILT